MNLHKKMGYFLAAWLFTVANVTESFAIANPVFSPASASAEIKVEGNTVTYTGKLSEDNVALFLERVKGRSLQRLVINSGGGEINAGMTMGSWVFDNHIDIIVNGMCMSSCANYVFPAGRTKTLHDGSVVAWHGNILQKSGISEDAVRKSVTDAFNALPEAEKKKQDLEALITKSLAQMNGYITASMKRQADFFAKIGVDEYICRIGTEEYGARDFYILSVDDMKRFGIRNIQATEGYENTDLSPFLQQGRQIEYIKLRE